MLLVHRNTATHPSFVLLFGILTVTLGIAFSGAASGQGLKPVAFNFPPRDFTCAGQVIASGDFNNDDHPDLICLGGPSLILLGDGHGGFKPGIAFPPSNAAQVVLNDLNGDGNLDVIVLDGYNPLLYIYLGNGDGTFQAPITISEFTYSSFEMATGDINGDGKLDLILMETSAPLAAIFLGNGDGTFRDGGTIQLPYVPAYPALVDLNGDGALDLVVSEFSGTEEPTLTVALGNGNGTFKPATSSPLLGNPGPVLAGDFNADGKQDVFVYSISSMVANVSDLLIGNGDGTFQSPKATLSGISACGVIVGDFNHDGKLDIAAQITNQNKVEILLGDGTGSFSDFASFPIAYSVNAFYAQTLVTGYFNDDSNLDLVIGGDSPVVSSLIGKGDGGFVLPPHVDDHNLLNVTVGDLNGDGRLDIVSVNSAGALGVLLGNGDSTFQETNYFPAGKGAREIVLGDFNRDGKLDAILASADGYLAVLPGKENGAFDAAIVTQAGYANSTPSAVAVGDFNGDGILDAAINAPSEIFLGKGDGTFGPAIPYVNGQGRIALGVADVNGDGKLDLIALESTDGLNGGADIVVLLGNGDGTFGSPSHYPVDFLASSFSIADLNGDGIPDIAVATAATVDVLLGNRDGTFQFSVSYYSGVGSSGLSIADFNSDGWPDLAVTNGNGTDAYIMLNYGDGTFRLGSTFLGAAVQSFYPVTGDFNGDGNPDLAVAGKNAIFVYTNTTK